MAPMNGRLEGHKASVSMHIVPGRFGLILLDHKRQRNTADLDRSAQHAAMHGLSLVNVTSIWFFEIISRTLPHIVLYDALTHTMLWFLDHLSDSLSL
jgi:hypothetical protein